MYDYCFKFCICLFYSELRETTNQGFLLKELNYLDKR